VHIHGDKVTAIGSVASSIEEADLPTVVRRLPHHLEFVPSERAKHAAETSRKAFAVALLRLCHDSHGKVTSRRIFVSNGVAEFDREFTEHFASVPIPAFTFNGTAIAACYVIHAVYPPPPPPPGYAPAPAAIPNATTRTER
jgi:hypothetical protein